MSKQNVAVAFCADNEATVKSLINPLSITDYSFQYYPCTRTTNEASLSDQLLGQDASILLFISDNFLKSAQCMSHALKLLNEKKQVILPIVIEGVAKNEEDGTITAVPTDFDRVSDIIQYINYWQDQYLDLRRQKRQIEGLDEEKFNAHLKTMREISSEAGEFLRLLRSMIYLNKYELHANHYEQFFLFQDDTEGWQRFKTQVPVLNPITEEARPPVEISAIPGADMLGLGEEAPKIEVEQQEETSPAEESIPLEPSSDIPISEEESEDHSSALEIQEVDDTPTDSSSDEVLEDASFDFSGGQNTEEELTIELDVDHSEDSIEEGEDKQEEEEEIEHAEEVADNQEGDEEEEEYDDDDDDDDDDDEEVEDIGRMVEEAIEYFDTGQVQEGLAFLAHAVEQYPDEPYLKYHYALFIAQKTENYVLAGEELEPVLEMEPDNEDALFLMGELRELQGDYKAARICYQQLIKLNPKYPDAYYRLGMITASHYSDDSTLAAEYFREASEADPQNLDAFYQYAVLLNDPLGKPKKAIKLLKHVINEAPQHPFAHYDLALIYHDLGKVKKAQNAYKQAISINPELQTPENDLAFSSLVKADKTESSVVYDNSFTLDAIESLKNNIKQLEDLLHASEKETTKLQEALQQEQITEEERPSVDKTVFITGATSGIGKATAERFAEEGYRVIINGRRAGRLEEFKEELIEQYNAEVLSLSFDVRDRSAIEAAVSQLEGKWADIDLLINNAGKAKGLAPIHEGQIAHWEEMIDTNLKGLLYLTRMVSPGMVKRQSGHIINICSTAGKEVYPNGNVYCATKFAVDALTKAMRIDLHQHGVRVSMVSPAHVDETEFALVRFDGNKDKARIYNDFKPLSASDVADTLFYISNQPKHINILDIVMQGTQQAHSMIIDRSGRDKYEEEE